MTHPSDDEIEGLAERFVNALNPKDGLVMISVPALKLAFSRAILALHQRAKAAEKERDERDADAGRWAARADEAYLKLEAAEARLQEAERMLRETPPSGEGPG